MAPKTIENSVETIENHAETKHLNSTRTARPPRAWQFESNSNATEKMAFVATVIVCLFGRLHNLVGCISEV